LVLRTGSRARGLAQFRPMLGRQGPTSLLRAAFRSDHPQPRRAVTAVGGAEELTFARRFKVLPAHRAAPLEARPRFAAETSALLPRLGNPFARCGDGLVVFLGLRPAGGGSLAHLPARLGGLRDAEMRVLLTAGRL